jgi:hypothetical protein
VIKPVSADSLRKKGNIRGHSRRLSAISLPRSKDRESGDPGVCEISRDFRASLALVIDIGWTQDWLADLAGIELSYSRMQEAL